MLFFKLLLLLLPRCVRDDILYVVLCLAFLLIFGVMPIWVSSLGEGSVLICFGVLGIICAPVWSILLMSFLSKRVYKWHELGLRYVEQAKGYGRDPHAIKAAKYFMKAAYCGGSLDHCLAYTAIVNLGWCYACGFGVDKDFAKAAKCYKEAANGECGYDYTEKEAQAIAQFALGLCYAEGIGVDMDKIKAEDLFSKVQLSMIISKVQRSMIMPSWGKDLMWVREVKRGDLFWNSKEVLIWLREAGERGNVRIQINLGDYYRSVDDHAEAVKWYRKVADAEYDFSTLHDFSLWGRKKRLDATRKLYDMVICHLSLADIYEVGSNGVGKDEAEAARRCRKVADSKLVDFVVSNFKRFPAINAIRIKDAYTRSQVDLGRFYLDGIGVGKDEVEAVKWFRKAAEQGDADGQTFLADCYLFGRGVVKDEAEALVWFRRAAKGYDPLDIAKNYLKAVEDGDPESQCNLASAYLDGWRGVKKNEAEAVKWFRKAAEQGYTDGQNSLGKCYLDGTGVGKDEAEAVKWFRKAAEQGNDVGQYWLGKCYLDSTGVGKDEVEAVKWFRKAAEQGHVKAIARLEELTKSSLG